MELDEVLSKLDRVKQQPKGFSARCPAHDDHVASLSVDAGREGGIVVNCHTGCKPADVMAAVGLTLRDLMGKPHITETYVYTDDDGRPLWHVERWANPKDFRCRPGLPPLAQRRLYRAEALAWARERGAVVWYVEGEKDANRLADLGMVSTCNVGGASKSDESTKWLPHYAEQVKGCQVVIVADNDEVGRAHARTVAKGCATTAASVAIVVPRYGNDISELLDLGWTLDALDPLPEEAELGVLLAANVRTRPTSWAWPGYIPFGAVSMGEGDPGDGKSIMTTDLNARWSSGAPMPDGARHDGPYNVLMVSAEDDPETTVVPRLRAAGADLYRVELVTYGTDPGKPFTISTDMRALARHVIERDIRIITFDPLMAFVGDDTDSHNDHSVRRALYPLYRLAQDTGAAVIVIRHLNKGQGKAVYRGGGSIAFIGAARAAYAIGRDPEQPERRVLACVKMNIARHPPSLVYSIKDSEKGPYLEWHGAIDADAQQVVDGEMRSDALEIIQFLNTVVENGEPMSWVEIVKRGKEDGYTERQLRHRRNRSRLLKIPGRDGARSTRWGYLEHTLVHLPEVNQLPPSTTVSQARKAGGDLAGGPPTSDPPLPARRQTVVDGGRREDDWQAGAEPGEAGADRRDSLLDAAAPVCEVCGSAEAVLKYGDPYWVVRCIPHNPEDYGGGK